MANNELEIRLKLIDEATARFNKIANQLENRNQKLKSSFVDLAAKVYLFTKAIKVLWNTAKMFVDAASKVEQYNVKLKTLLGSIKEGTQVFQDMQDLASQVPKTYDEIMDGATQLAGVVRNGAEEIKDLMPIIVDIASGTGLTVQETTSQMVRMYSAGASAADLFRDRGISAALGFQAGVSYSAEETMKKITEQWDNGTSKFAGAADALAGTWVGRVSMMQDAWFKFSSELGKFITDSPVIAEAMNNITTKLNQLADTLKKFDEYETGKLMKEFSNLKDEIKEAVKPDYWKTFVDGMEVTWNPLDNMQRRFGLIKDVIRGAMGTEQHAQIAQLSKELEGVTQQLLNMGVVLEDDMLEGFFSPGQIANMRDVAAEFIRIEEEKNEIIRQKQEYEADNYINRERKKIDQLKEMYEAWYEEESMMKLVAQDEEASRMKFYIDSQKQAHENMWELAGKARDVFASGTSSALTGLITGSQKASESFKQMGTQLVSMIVEWGVRRLVASAIATTALAKEVAEATVAGAQVATAWADAAAMTSLATFGANAIPAAAGIASTSALAKSIAITPMAEGGIIKARPGGIFAQLGEAGRDEAVIPLDEDNTFGNVTIENIVINGNIDSGDISRLAEELGFEIERELRYSRSI